MHRGLGCPRAAFMAVPGCGFALCLLYVAGTFHPGPPVDPGFVRGSLDSIYNAPVIQLTTLLRTRSSRFYTGHHSDYCTGRPTAMDRDPWLKLECGRAVDVRIENPFIQDDPSMSMVIARCSFSFILFGLIWTIWVEYHMIDYTETEA